MVIGVPAGGVDDPLISVERNAARSVPDAATGLGSVASAVAEIGGAVGAAGTEKLAVATAGVADLIKDKGINSHPIACNGGDKFSSPPFDDSPVEFFPHR